MRRQMTFMSDDKSNSIYCSEIVFSTFEHNFVGKFIRMCFFYFYGRVLCRMPFFYKFVRTKDPTIQMKDYLILCCLFQFVALPLFSQPFQHAPVLAKKVKKIVEWTRNDFQEESDKGFISEFDRKGNLLAFYHASHSPKQGMAQQFDQKGQILSCVEGQAVDQMVSKYFYGPNKISIVKTFRGKVFQTHQFYNQKGKIKEEKTSLKGGELGDEFILKDRILYHYKGDSLSGETHYNYALEGKRKGKAHQKRKTTYDYHPTLKHRTKRTVYDFDGSIRHKSEYRYDQKGRLQFLIQHFPRENNKRIVAVCLL